MTKERSTRAVRRSRHAGRRACAGLADVLARLEAERAGEDRQAAQDRLFILPKQIVTPGDGGFEGLLARRCGSAAANEQMEAVVEALDHLIEAKRTKSNCCELDRQWDPVESTRQLDHGGPVVRGYLEGRAGLSCTFDEQGDGLGLGDAVRRQLLLVVRYRERTHLDDRFPCDPEGLPARGEDPHRRRLTENRIGEHRTGVEQVLTVVENEQQPLGGDVLDQPGHRPPTRLIAKTERGHDRLGDELWIPQAGELHQPDAIRNPAIQIGCRPQRQARFADATGTDEGHHTRAGQGRLDLLELVATADEACQLRRHVAPGWGGAAGHGYPYRRRTRTMLSTRMRNGVSSARAPDKWPSYHCLLASVQLHADPALYCACSRPL